MVFESVRKKLQKIIAIPNALAQLDQLRSQLEKYQTTNEQLEAKIKELEKERKNHIPLGERTSFISSMSLISHYLFDPGKKHEDAVPWIDKLFETTQQKGNSTTICVYEDRDRKDILFLDREFQENSLRLKSKWLFNRYSSTSEASIVAGLHSTLAEEAQKMDQTTCVPRVKQAGKYLMMEMVLGPDLYTFFKSLAENPPNKMRDELASRLVMKQIKDNAFIRTRNYEIKHFQKSSHGDKILEVLNYANIDINRESIRNYFNPLNAQAHYPLRDGASWNSILNADLSKYFLSEDFLNDKPSISEIDKMVDEGVVAVDLDKLTRFTFPQDDAIHTLEWPLPVLMPSMRAEVENYFVKELARHGENTSTYWNTRELAGLYRHVRMWYFYEKQPDMDANGSSRRFHVNMASHYLRGSARDIKGLSELMVQACGGA